jgi:hypothetical protein
MYIFHVQTSRDASPLNFVVSGNESRSENESILMILQKKKKKEDEDDDENTVFGLEWHEDDGFWELIYPSSDDEKVSEDEKEFEEKFSDLKNRSDDSRSDEEYKSFMQYFEQRRGIEVVDLMLMISSKRKKITEVTTELEGAPGRIDLQ